MTEQKKVTLSDAVENRLVDWLNPPVKKDELKVPANKVGLALVAFNVIFFFLDAGTAVTIGIVIGVFYGIAAFVAGFAPMLAHEQLFSNAHASKRQRLIAGSGVLLGALTTLTAGILVAILNVGKVFNLQNENIGYITVILLVVSAFLHGALFLAYYFVDEGIVLLHKFVRDMAKHGEDERAFVLADKKVSQALEMKSRVDGHVAAGSGALIGAAFKSLTGQELPMEQSGNGRIPADPQMPITAQDKRLYSSEVAADKSFREPKG